MQFFQQSHLHLVGPPSPVLNVAFIEIRRGRGRRIQPDLVTLPRNIKGEGQGIKKVKQGLN